MSELALPLAIAPADWEATPPIVRAVVLALLDPTSVDPESGRAWGRIGG